MRRLLEKTAREDSEGIQRGRQRGRQRGNTAGKTAGDITEDVAVPSQADLLKGIGETLGIGGKIGLWQITKRGRKYAESLPRPPREPPREPPEVLRAQRESTEEITEDITEAQKWKHRVEARK